MPHSRKATQLASCEVSAANPIRNWLSGINIIFSGNLSRSSRFEALRACVRLQRTSGLHTKSKTDGQYVRPKLPLIVNNYVGNVAGCMATKRRTIRDMINGNEICVRCFGYGWRPYVESSHFGLPLKRNDSTICEPFGAKKQSNYELHEQRMADSKWKLKNNLFVRTYSAMHKEMD